MKTKYVISLMIIGFAILILIGIGITYAFFSSTNTVSGTTKINATTEKVGIVTIYNPTSDLHIKLHASDMTEEAAGTTGKVFYATTLKEENYSNEYKEYTISSLSIMGGAEDTEYNCSFKIDLEKSNVIKQGDMKMNLSLNGATINDSNSLFIDLSQALDSYIVKFTYKGNTTENIDLVKASVQFWNQNTAQDHLLEKELITAFTNSEINCAVE